LVLSYKEEPEMTKNDKILEKIQKLLALAGNNPSENEAKAAMLKAQELMKEYHIENPETIEDDKVVCVKYDLGTIRKSDFVLMLSVLVANNFRAKTTHFGQTVYFIGFEADAKCAMEIWAYVLHFALDANNKFFANKVSTETANRDWWYGFLVGLNLAFNSRKGYELMVQVPRKVLECFDAIQKTPFEGSGEKDQSNRPSTLKGAFTDGFRRGRESMEHKELEQVG